MMSSLSEWGSVAVPGMKPAMVFVADLQCMSEWVLIQELNPILEQRGLERVEFIDKALSKLKAKYLCEAVKEEMLEVLADFFTAKTGSKEVALAAMREWPLVTAWRRQRVALASPWCASKIDRATLESLKQQVQQAEPYAPVRNAAMVLIGAAEKMIAET
ncbi:hypothetical protein GPECTOR_1296g542 [Gonium pectorale]|uniref:Uncharacterized protein n=1 Tax=Gonium pectorale TaxID=33097 RepID=A0A150FTH0_GONPE|nr:hypothetical protein GPECTOR_1296g542 [Gonium pectorale]|eukprot:KXZ40923.1 hypothetical protein GPECTOR_1296g542 [Gonium pectorale]